MTPGGNHSWLQHKQYTTSPLLSIPGQPACFLKLGHYPAEHLSQVYRLSGFQDQAALVALQAQPPVASHELPHIGTHIAGDRVTAMSCQHIQDVAGTEPAGGGVPQGQMGYPVGMDILRALYQLRKAHELVPHLFEGWSAGVQEEGAVALDNERLDVGTAHGEHALWQSRIKGWCLNSRVDFTTGPVG